MNPETRLAEILTALESVGLTCLVLGGYAVRFYGLDRNTNDFDLHLAPDCWPDLPTRLSQTSLFAGKSLLEGPSWRPNAFRRFQIGTLPSGRACRVGESAGWSPDHTMQRSPLEPARSA